jgi:hypothetical protein
MDAPALVNAKSMIDMNTAPFEEIEALPSFIREKMQSSDEFKGRIAHAENMAGRPSVLTASALRWRRMSISRRIRRL